MSDLNDEQLKNMQEKILKPDVNRKIDSQSPQLWDKVAETYAEEAGSSELELGHEIECLLADIGIKPGASLLEVGCGSGHLSGYLASNGFKTTLMDFSKVAIEKAKAYYEKHNLIGNFILCDMIDLSTEKVEPHDVVWNSGVFEHFDSWQVIDVLKKMENVSQKFVIILVPNSNSIPYLLFRRRAMENNEWLWGRELLRNSMKHLAEAANLEVLEERYIGHHYSPAHLGYVNSELGQEYRDMYQQNIIPDNQGYLIALVARPRSGQKIAEYENLMEKILKEEAIIAKKTYSFDLFAISNRLQKVQEELTGLKSQLSDKNDEVANLQDPLTGLELQLSDKNDEVANLQDTLTDLESQLSDKNDEVANLQGTLTGLELQLSDKKDEVANLQDTLTGLELQLSDKNDEVANLEDTLTGLESQLSDKNDEVANLQGTLTGLKSQLSDKNDEVTNLQGTLTGLESQLSDKNDEVANLQGTLTGLESQLSDKNDEVTNLQGTLTGLESQLNDKNHEIEQSLSTIKEKDGEIAFLKETIRERESSISWSLAQLYDKYFKYDTHFSQSIIKILNKILVPLPKFDVIKKKDSKEGLDNKSFSRNVYHTLHREGMMGLIIGMRTKLREKKQEVKKIEFNPYDRLQLLKPIDVAITNKDYSKRSDIINDCKFSVVLPVKNEEKTIAKLLNSIKNQSLKPDEVIIIDGNSEDKTVSIIKNYADENNDLNIKVIEPDGGNLSKHRNIGIQEAKNEWIILTDAGTMLNENVYLNLIGSITDHSDADLVCGIYFPIKKSYWSSKFVWDWDDMDYTTYLPSTRVMGIKRSIALTIGGFPEYLTFTGDDTLFDINYRKISTKWVINKSAYAFWGSAKDRRKALRRAYLYGKGDGESGVGDSRFYEYLIYRTENIKNEIADDVTRAFFEGYLEGREDRVSILAERKGVQGNILILSGVPLTDTGGGARGTQMVLEFSKKNYKVTFCNVYHSFETSDKIFLDIDIPLIELYYLNNFSIEEYIERHRMIIDKTIVILEFPHPDFIPIINKLKEVEPNIQIIYDCIDNWDSDLGWIWYTKEKEIEIMEMSDIIVASANTLVDRLKKLTNKEVHLIPNAVNLRIFDRAIKPSKPNDLPDDEKPIVIYIGALWGTWFDWELVKYVAAYATDFNFIFIGNMPDDNSYIQELVTYPNVFFLGLKPQYLLPHYLKHSDVCIIPFKYDEKIIKYTNPLKIYEYLAMGKPVVSTYMDELISMPQILLSKNYNEFAENIQEALKITIDYPVLEKYIHENSIEKRVDDLLKIVKSARETKGKNQRRS